MWNYCDSLELGLVRMAYITLSDILTENIERTVSREPRPREMLFAQIQSEIWWQRLGNNLSLSQF